MRTIHFCVRAAGPHASGAAGRPWPCLPSLAGTRTIAPGHSRLALRRTRADQKACAVPGHLLGAY
eukprot:4906076-Prymnesium_polylepis.1